MSLTINSNWRQISEATRAQILDLPNSAPFIDLFLEKASEVNESTTLLAKLVLIISNNNFSESTLNKIQQVFAKTIFIKGIRTFLANKPSQTVFQLSQEELEHHTRLTFACAFCDLETIKQVAKGRDLNEVNKKGSTPLKLACLNNRPDVALFLLEQGARTDIADLEGETALHSACESGCLEALQRIAIPDNIDLLNKKNSTPLMIACYKNQPHVVRYLLELGAQRNLVNSDGWTAFHYACQVGCLEAVQMLMSPDNMDLPIPLGATPLMIACENNHPNVVRYLLEQGAQRNLTKSDGWTAFHYACKGGCLEAVQMLLTPNNIELLIEGNLTPLMIACDKNHSDAVRYLLAKGAQKDAVDSKNWMPFHYACNGGCLEAVQLLLTPDNIDRLIDEKFNPLMLACGSNRPDVVRYLLTQGAQKDAVDSIKWTPLHYACLGGCLEAVQMLLTSDNIDLLTDENTTPLMLACYNKHPDVARYLLERGAKRDLADIAGTTALHFACYGGCLEAAQMLLTQDNINLLTNSDETPLQLSIEKMHYDISIYLIEQGALLENVDPEIVEEEILPHFLEKLAKMTKDSKLFDRIKIIRPFLEFVKDSELSHAKLEIVGHYYQHQEPVKTAQALIDQLGIEQSEEQIRVVIRTSDNFLKELPMIQTFFTEIFGVFPKDLGTKSKELTHAITNARARINAKNLQDREKLKEFFKDQDIYQILYEWGIGGQPGQQSADSLYQERLGIDDPSYLYSAGIETGADLVEKVGIDNEIEILFKTQATREELLEALSKKIEKARESAGELIKKFEPSDQELVIAERNHNISALRFYLTITAAKPQTE